MVSPHLASLCSGSPRSPWLGRALPGEGDAGGVAGPAVITVGHNQLTVQMWRRFHQASSRGDPPLARVALGTLSSPGTRAGRVWSCAAGADAALVLSAAAPLCWRWPGTACPGALMPFPPACSGQKPSRGRFVLLSLSRSPEAAT